VSTVVSLGTQQAAIAMSPGTSKPSLWHSINAPNAARSDTQTTASALCSLSRWPRIARAPSTIEIGGGLASARWFTICAMASALEKSTTCPIGSAGSS